MPRSTRFALTIAAAVVLLFAIGCGRRAKNSDEQSKTTLAPIVVKDDSGDAAAKLGFPAFATKNTIRVAGADPVADAAAVSRAVFSAGSDASRPQAVVLADRRDWRAVIAASVLMARPLRAPMLLADGPKDVPAATADALRALKPTGSAAAGNAEVLRIGAVPTPSGFQTTDVRGTTPAALARAVDAFASAASGVTTDRVMVVSDAAPAFALPAAGLAAKSGVPVLYVSRTTVPKDTLEAIRSHANPTIYVMGPSSVISPKVTKQLRAVGKIKRVGGPTPVTNAIAVAQYLDGSFGWGVTDPGHGLVFARADVDPATAGAVAPLSASGTYGPLLLNTSADTLDPPLATYLKRIQPGYEKDPVRGVYNRGWIIGDATSLSVTLQSAIDDILEIIPVNQRVEQP